MLAVAAAWFGDGVLKAAAERMSAAMLWLLGPAGVERWQSLTPQKADDVQHFPSGGVVVVRQGGNYLFVDIGEVGLKGRGGHGHNDLLSYELTLQGRPIVVDPGCPVYTGDLALRDRFRGTACHNGTRIDGEEIAPLKGPWTISNAALPRDAGDAGRPPPASGAATTLSSIARPGDAYANAGVQPRKNPTCGPPDCRGEHRIERSCTSIQGWTCNGRRRVFAHGGGRRRRPM